MGSRRWPDFLERLATMGRVICFDKRGTGISDPVPLGAIPTIERWMDDITTVIDAVGSTRITFFGHGDEGPIAMLFAATYPERTEALVLGDTFARMRQAVDYPVGLSEAAAEAKAAAPYASWGREDRQRPARLTDQRSPPGARASSGCRSAQALSRRCTPSAISTSTSAPCSDRSGRRRSCSPPRQLLDPRRVRTPSGGAHRRGDVRRDRRQEHRYYTGDVDGICRRQQLVTGEHEAVATIACSRRSCSPTSSDRRRRLPASATGQRPACPPSCARAATDRAFPRARSRPRAMASRCSTARPGLRPGHLRAVRALRLEVRAGLHTGECERIGDNVGGIAVHIGARIAGEAAPGEVLASSTVRDLVVGSGLIFRRPGAALSRACRASGECSRPPETRAPVRHWTKVSVRTPTIWLAPGTCRTRGDGRSRISEHSKSRARRVTSFIPPDPASNRQVLARIGAGAFHQEGHFELVTVGRAGATIRAVRPQALRGGSKPTLA